MILQIATLILAVPVGYWIAWFARDELVSGRNWFKLLIVLAFANAVVFSTLEQTYVVLTSAFIAIVSGISLWKSFDKKWVKKRI